MDDLYTIDTPENIEFAYDVAGIGSRFLAAIIDTLLIIIAEVLVLFAAGVLASATGVFEQFGAAESVIAALAGLAAFIILWGYYIIFELVWSGQSPGKRAIGLRVVRDGGRPITFLASAIRNLIRLVDFLPALYGVGVVAMFIDKRSRRLGDLAGGTLVVAAGKTGSVTVENTSGTTTASGTPQASNAPQAAAAAGQPLSSSAVTSSSSASASRALQRSCGRSRPGNTTISTALPCTHSFTSLSRPLSPRMGE